MDERANVNGLRAARNGYFVLLLLIGFIIMGWAFGLKVISEETIALYAITVALGLGLIVQMLSYLLYERQG